MQTHTSGPSSFCFVSEFREGKKNNRQYTDKLFTLGRKDGTLLPSLILAHVHTPLVRLHNCFCLIPMYIITISLVSKQLQYHLHVWGQWEHFHYRFVITALLQINWHKLRRPVGNMCGTRMAILPAEGQQVSTRSRSLHQNSVDLLLTPARGLQQKALLAVS